MNEGQQVKQGIIEMIEMINESEIGLLLAQSQGIMDTQCDYYGKESKAIEIINMVKSDKYEMDYMIGMIVSVLGNLD